MFINGYGKMKRNVFIISDGTGITAEALGQSLISQFEGIQFDTTVIPYVDDERKALEVVEKLNACYQQSQNKPLVFATLVLPKIREILTQSHAEIFDLFGAFLKPLEHTLKAKSSYTVGRSHGLVNSKSYKERIDAINYTLNHDDGINTKNYQEADIILIGVSRSGKTPTCLYMALQYGVWAANYPLTEEDLSNPNLPDCLKPYQDKLFGLTIHPQNLHQIRTERRPNSRYASLKQCTEEVHYMENLYRKKNIPFLNATHHSIEEISTHIMAETKIERRIN